MLVKEILRQDNIQFAVRLMLSTLVPITYSEKIQMVRQKDN